MLIFLGTILAATACFYWYCASKHQRLFAEPFSAATANLIAWNAAIIGLFCSYLARAGYGVLFYFAAIIFFAGFIPLLPLIFSLCRLFFTRLTSLFSRLSSSKYGYLQQFSRYCKACFDFLDSGKPSHSYLSKTLAAIILGIPLCALFCALFCIAFGAEIERVSAWLFCFIYPSLVACVYFFRNGRQAWLRLGISCLILYLIDFIFV
ncbi:MAG: hypothetical protein IJ566_06775 [Cardiobacteriaceae bacterium]|nr:hypothetical protein [Cardiobacteriaceae bacterium]